MAKTKQPKLPEIGQWPDRLAPAAIIGALVLTTVGFLMAFFYAVPVNGAAVNGAELIGGSMVTSKLLLSQKIFYFHMPVAITSMVVMVFMAYYCIRYLTTREQRFDMCAKVCMEVALLFVIATMITGEMWTRFEWGVWWTWEPRLTTYLILTILVIAYFILRTAIDDPERRGVFAAVFGLISFLDVPITFMVTRIIPSSLHPVVMRESGMTLDMGLTVAVCAVGFLLLAFGLYRFRFRGQRLAERTQALKEALDE
ncbi:MAG: cytochrome c biogenesis protein [Coriobacteriia bacterium]|nr:cytochrome c biogenesis protein [Coriobacteriia bacterium]